MISLKKLLLLYWYFKKHKSISSFTCWWHKLFSHCFWSFARRYINTIYVIICLDYVLWTSIDLIKEDGFTKKKTRSRWYPTETITSADYADDLALLAKTSGESSRRHWPLRERKQNRVYLFKTSCHFHSRGQNGKISRRVHIRQMQYVIYWK